MTADSDLQALAREVAAAVSEGRDIWVKERFEHPWFIGPHIPGCDCDITYHDAQNVTLGLRLNCPHHRELAIALAQSWTPD